MQQNGKKYVYITTDDAIIKKEVTKEKSFFKKLDKLRELIVKYTKIYEMVPNGASGNTLERENIKEKVNEWIDSTIRYYEVNYVDALDSIIAYYEFKLSEEEVKKNKTKSKKF